MAILRRRRPLHFLQLRLINRLIYVIIALGLIHTYYLHLSYYESLADKYSPTTIPSRTQQENFLRHRGTVDFGEHNESRRGLLDNRLSWKKLGSGYEGDTFTFNGSVIKVFKPDRSPLRNCVADSATQTSWPPEIPVSLLLGGLEDSTSSLDVQTDESSFLPVQDYFFLPIANDNTTGEWHLVTRFLVRGTLEHAARRLQIEVPSPVVEQIDARFRPSLNRILGALAEMHSQYGLCHDDIKIDNIFVEDLTSTVSSSDHNHSIEGGRYAHWFLGDLGNARQLSHPYHTSLLWTHDNGQHPDCRINDVLRLMRTYALFLQSATSSPKTQAELYNDVFLSGSAPWSQLYWHTVNSAWDGATMAEEVRELSTTTFAPLGEDASVQDEHQEIRRHPTTPGYQEFWFDGLFTAAAKALAVKKELRTGGSVSEKWAKIFGTMGILKTPSRGCKPAQVQPTSFFS